MTYPHEIRDSQSGFNINATCLPPLVYWGVSQKMNSLANISREIHSTANTTVKTQLKIKHQIQQTAEDYLFDMSSDI